MLFKKRPGFKSYDLSLNLIFGLLNIFSFNKNQHGTFISNFNINEKENANGLGTKRVNYDVFSIKTHSYSL